MCVPCAVNGVKGKDTAGLEHTRHFSDEAREVVEVLEQIHCYDTVVVSEQNAKRTQRSGEICQSGSKLGLAVNRRHGHGCFCNRARRSAPTASRCGGNRMEKEHPPIDTAIRQRQRVCGTHAEAYTRDATAFSPPPGYPGGPCRSWTVPCPRDGLFELVDAHHVEAISPGKVVGGHSIAASNIYKPAWNAFDEPGNIRGET
jgi:hypothetical protein